MNWNFYEMALYTSSPYQNHNKISWISKFSKFSNFSSESEEYYVNI